LAAGHGRGWAVVTARTVREGGGVETAAGNQAGTRQSVQNVIMREISSTPLVSEGI